MVRYWLVRLREITSIIERGHATLNRGPYASSASVQEALYPEKEAHDRFLDSEEG